MNKYALLVIDMQNAYFHNDALAQKKALLLKNANELLEAAVAADIAIFNIVTEHKRDRSTWSLNMLDDGQGYLFEGEPDTKLVEGLEVSRAVQLTKTRDSAFFETNLLDSLKSLDINTVILLGVSTHSCVLYTAADAYARNLKVVLATDAIASHDPEYHDQTLKMLSQEYRQRCLGNSEIIKLFS